MRLTVEQASAIYDVLIAECGATEFWRSNFLTCLSHDEIPCREYRFQGTLGFGGKFYKSSDAWRVDCYPEDRTAEREAVIVRTNARLREMFRAALTLKEPA